MFFDKQTNGIRERSMMKLTEVEEERQYLLLVTAAAVRARLIDASRIDYTIDRLQRVVKQATEAEYNEIVVIAQGELDVANRLKEENPTQRVNSTEKDTIKPRIQGDYIVIGNVPETALEITYPEANSLQADLRELLGAAGVTMRDAV
ncbi:MAG: hypothetical protein JWN75_861 [Candidatus Saccharibacteria bacterium]|nr:hypothetical protein [Candidatus Saccharibacteria bacterium]